MGNRFSAAVVSLAIVLDSVCPVGAQPPATPTQELPPAQETAPAQESAPAPQPAPAGAPPPPGTAVYYPVTLPPPTYGAPQTRAPGEVSGPMIGGLVLVGAGYGFSLITGIFGVMIGAAAPRCDRCIPYSRWMFLPVAGPWFAMAREAESRPGRVYAGVLGASQGLGVVFITIGALVGAGPSPNRPVAFGVRPDGIDLTIRF